MMRTRRHIPWLAMALLLLTSLGPEGARSVSWAAVGKPAPAAAGPAQKIVDRWLKGKSLRGLRVGVSVVDASSGSTLAEHNSEVRLNPASGTKLLTTAAALHLLPTQPKWNTQVYGVLSGDTLKGPLRVLGGGDPKLLLAHLEQMAGDIVTAGVNAIPDGLVVHVGRFDDQGLPPAYEQKQTDAGYRPSVGAAAANFGAVRVTVKPGRRLGARLSATVEGGSEAVELDVAGKTVSGQGESVSVVAARMPDGRTKIRVGGQLGIRAAAYDTRKRLFDPDRWTGDVLRALLNARGVRVGPTVTVTRDPVPQGTGPALSTITNRSLSETLADVNQWSNNFMAEMVLKQMGCEATEACTWKRGTEQVSATLVDLGVSPEGFDYVNGSGLYRATTISAAAMTTLLTRMAADPIRGPVFSRTLAVSGQPGTLRGRLVGRNTRGKVRGKTGTLDEVVSLSGYVVTRRGRSLAFSVLVNRGTPVRTGQIRRKIDRLIRQVSRL